MRLVTSGEMKKLDLFTINDLEVPDSVLMELAGFGVVQKIIGKWEVESSTFLIICGKGNNGGDGYVVARHLFNKGLEVSILSLGPEKLGKSGKINYDVAVNLDIPIYEVTSTADLMNFENIIQNSDFIIDAVFGTGLDRPIMGIAREIISAVNATDSIKIAVDMPSGISADHGCVLGEHAIKADLTVTFAFPKIGQFSSPGFAYCGEVEVVDIGVVDHQQPQSRRCFLLTDNWVRSNLPYRPAYGHKGTFGHTLIMAGSIGKSGAAIMASEAAVSAGAGLVTVLAPQNIIPTLMGRLTEVMGSGYGTEDGTIQINDYNLIKAAMANKKVMAIGPGIPNNEIMLGILEKIIKNSEIPLVLDADALNLISRNPQILKNSKVPILITPHPGEFSRLFDQPVAQIQKRRIETALEFARKYKVFVLLKGARSIIASPQGEIAVNPTGNNGMASGGTGDVLTGITASFISQGVDPFTAAGIGAFLHGRAGDLAAREKGKFSLKATDLIQYLPVSFYSLNSENLHNFSEKPYKQYIS
ncbi:MAG: NAD(P)H-hydrate dehydratase [Myxococcota bacterium]